jgi:cation/acetate symporter
LKNPGILSITLGFLAVLLGSLLFRDPRSEALWPEVYARQNTGILASRAVVH